MSAEKTPGLGTAIGSGLAEGAKGLLTVAGKRVVSSMTDRIGETTERLTDYATNGGGPGLLAAITGRGGKQKNGKGTSLKVTNIVEHIDVGVPLRLAYDQWTRFTDFPTFMKKVESVEQEEDTKLRWKAQVFWSHRTWESTIIEQVPDTRIVWQSEGEKGTVDGAVTFHELAPELTRVCLNLQYHPQGFFERVGNLWRAQGRRARLELKHFARHVMNEAALHPDEVEGWRGEIHDGEVTKDNEEARGEQQEAESTRRGSEPRGSGRRKPASGRSGSSESRPTRRRQGSREQPRRVGGRG